MGTSDLPPQQQNPYPNMTPASGYPGQPPAAGTVNAPGGYAAAPAGAPPGAYPSSSSYPAPQQQAATYGAYPNDKLAQQAYPGAAAPYPGAAAEAGAAGYAPGGYPGTQQPTTAVGTPVVPGAMSVDSGPVKNTCCGGSCSAGWVLFAVGFLFPICWIVGIFLPCCTRDRNDKRAAIGSFAGLAIYTIIIIVLAATAPNWRYY